MLPMFIDWLRSLDECSAATLPALPSLVLSNAVTTDGLPRVYEYLFYSSLATSCINAHADLMLFKGLAHENVRAIPTSQQHHDGRCFLGREGSPTILGICQEWHNPRDAGSGRRT